MRYTKKVSVWPVAFAGGLKHEGPICNNGVVTRFHVSWSPHRKFPMDMAGLILVMCGTVIPTTFPVVCYTLAVWCMYNVQCTITCTCTCM